MHEGTALLLLLLTVVEAVEETEKCPATDEAAATCAGEQQPPDDRLDPYAASSHQLFAPKLGEHVPRKQLPQFMLQQEFDPTSQEGQLYTLAAVDTLEEVLTKAGGKAVLSPPQNGDGGTVEATLRKVLQEWEAGLDMHNGMRELRVAVLGAGDMAGVPLKHLAEVYETVALVDVVLGGVQRAVQTLPYPLQHKVSMHREDVTGLLPAFRWKCEHLFGVVDTPDEAFKLLARYVQGPRFFPEHLQYDKGFNSSLRPVSTADVVIVNMLFHGAAEGFFAHLSHELTRLKQEAWGTIPNVKSSLGPAAAEALSANVKQHLSQRIAGKLQKNPNRRLLVVLSLDKRAEFTVDPETGAKQGGPRVTHAGAVDDGVLEYFKSLSGAEVAAEASGSMVAARWKAAGGARHYMREETVKITAVSFGRELSFEEWLEQARAGNREMWAG